MNDYEAVNIAEGLVEPEDESQHIAAWQHLIDTGLAWSLQGWFGRTAMNMIREGHCTPTPDRQTLHDHAHQSPHTSPTQPHADQAKGPNKTT